MRGSPRCIVFLTDYVYMTGQEDCKHLCLGYHLPDLFNHVDFVNSFQLITYRQYHLHCTDGLVNPLAMPGWGISKGLGMLKDASKFEFLHLESQRVLLNSYVLQLYYEKVDLSKYIYIYIYIFRESAPSEMSDWSGNVLSVTASKASKNGRESLKRI